MAYALTNIQDCLMITKKFERGAIFSATEQAGFALLTPLLDSILIQSKNYINQANAVEALSIKASKGEQPPAVDDQNQQPPPDPTDNDPDINPPSTNPTGPPVPTPPDGLLGSESVSRIARNLDKANDQEPGFGEKLAGNFGLLAEDGNLDASGIFDSKCIPCGLRVDGAGLEAFFTQIGTGFVNSLSETLEFYKNMFFNQLQQLQNMMDMFDESSATGKYIDMCALIKFLTDFMCIPDIARMIAALMALMQRQSFDMSGTFSLILGLIAPLVTPLISNLTSAVEQFIWLIIKPIECIIDAIQAMIAKLDYNVLFQNIRDLDKTLNLGGPKKGAVLPGNEENEAKYRKESPDYLFRLNKPRFSDDEPKVPWVDGQLPRRDTVEGERYAEFGFNMAGPLSTVIDAENASNQQAVEDKAQELNAIRRSGRGIDGSDANAVAKQRERERAAQDDYRSAMEKRDMSYIGRANKSIDKAVEGVKSSIVLIIQFLREAVQVVQGFFDYVFGELKKLIAEYLGDSTTMVAQLVKKNQIIQLVKLLTSIIKAFKRGAICEDDPDDVKINAVLSTSQDLNIWSDEDGNIHIDGDDEDLENALDDYVEAFGKDPNDPRLTNPPEDTSGRNLPRTGGKRKGTNRGDPSNGTSFDGTPFSDQRPDTLPSGAQPIQTGNRTTYPGTNPYAKDRGVKPSTTGQKLKSLIEFTGDPTLDSEIARATEQLTRTVNLVFKCPLNTSVAQTEQINEWIKSVNS